MIIPHILAGTTREHYIMLFSAAGAIALLAGVVGAWVGAYLGARRAMRTERLAGLVQSAAAIEMAPVLHALDAIAVEVERISEAQRFTTKILSDRPPIVLPRAEPKSITPH
jgi:hypothetical protein